MTGRVAASNTGRTGALAALLFAASLSSQSCSSSPTTVRAQQPAANANTPPPPPPAESPAAPPARARLALPDSVESWTFETFEGRVIRTAHYSIYTTDTQERLLDRIPTFVEAALTHYSTAITPLAIPTARMDTFLMANRSQWQRLTLRMLGERGVQVTYIERGGFTHAGRAYLFDIGPVDTLSLTGHEGWHQFSQTTFNERLPLVLEEGIAAFMEGHRWIGRELVFLPWANTERFDRLREAAANSGGTSLVSLGDLIAGNPEALLARGPRGPLTYYSQAWALVHFLREGERGKYAAGFQRMVADAAGGHLNAFVAAQLRTGGGNPSLIPLASTRQMLQVYINPDLEVLDQQYQAFIRRVVQTGSRDAVIEGRSPLQAREGR